MGEMKELIDEAVVERAILMLAVAGPLVGLVVGLLYGRRPGQRLATALRRGFAGGLLGPLIYGLWRLFSYLVRFEPAADPRQDYFGLERVDVLLLNGVIFAAVGLVVGGLVRKVREADARRAPSPGDQAADSV